MTRSIPLSNTLYSILLEADGKFLTLGREWIGALDKNQKESVCSSELFARDDPNYRDRKNYNKDECEYFGNAAVAEESIFIQNYVFDFSFEIKFHSAKVFINITG